MRFRNRATIGELYSPAMKIQTQEEADKYYDELLLHAMTHNPENKSFEEIQAMIKSNLAYFAGYYDNETRERVEQLFQCAHPVFGAIAEKGPPTPEEAFQMGMDAGTKLKEQGNLVNK